MNSTFHIGRRFLKIKYLCAAVNICVVAVFYFIYRYLLEESFPQFAGLPLAVVFFAIGLAAVKVTLWAADKYAAGISYQVTDQGLVVVQGRLERLLPWSSFTAAKLQPYRLQGVLPVEFQLGDKILVLNPYTDGLCRLTGLVLDRIREYAWIDPAAEQQTRDLTDVY